MRGQASSQPALNTLVWVSREGRRHGTCEDSELACEGVAEALGERLAEAEWRWCFFFTVLMFRNLRKPATSREWLPYYVKFFFVVCLPLWVELIGLKEIIKILKA